MMQRIQYSSVFRLSHSHRLYFVPCFGVFTGLQGTQRSLPLLLNEPLSNNDILSRRGALASFAVVQSCFDKLFDNSGTGTMNRQQKRKARSSPSQSQNEASSVLAERKSRIVWVDLEVKISLTDVLLGSSVMVFIFWMNGLDVDSHTILEMACVITDSDLNIVAEVSGT